MRLMVLFALVLASSLPGSALFTWHDAQRAVKPETTATETQHLTLTTLSSEATVAPGRKFSLILDVVPKDKMHVYAPEQKDYIPIVLTMKADGAFRTHPARYPKPEKFFFAPLKETQLVYSKPFRIVQEITVAQTPAVRTQKAAADGATLTLNGTLRYQACDDAICYLPTEVPVAWTVKLRSVER